MIIEVSNRHFVIWFFRTVGIAVTSNWGKDVFRLLDIGFRNTEEGIELWAGFFGISIGLLIRK